VARAEEDTRMPIRPTHSPARRPTGAAVLVSFALALASAELAAAGAPSSERRFEDLPRVCRQGPSAGEACATDADCGGSRCVVDVVPGKLLVAKVTLVVDDDVSRFDGAESIPSVVAATALIEFFHGGRKRVLAQTYQNLSGDTLADLIANLQTGPELADTGNSGRTVTEGQVADAVATRDIFDDLLFQQGDGEVVDEVRGLFRTTAEPFVVRVASKAPKFHYEDGSAGGLASVVQAEVSIRFVGGR
jgi:hypothetical protein